jgi:hypothetical protein
MWCARSGSRAVPEGGRTLRRRHRPAPARPAVAARVECLVLRSWHLLHQTVGHVLGDHELAGGGLALEARGDGSGRLRSDAVHSAGCSIPADPWQSSHGTRAAPCERSAAEWRG